VQDVKRANTHALSCAFLVRASFRRGVEKALLAVGDVSKRQVSGEAEWRRMSSDGPRHTQQARQGFFLF
jgi:hypothetical protein